MMDISSIIVAVVSGIFSILVIILQKGNNKVDRHIDKQNTFLERSKIVSDKLAADRKHLDALNRKMLLFILDTNVYILKENNDKDLIEEMATKSMDLKADLAGICDEINDLEKEKQLIEDVMEDMANQVQHDSLNMKKMK